MARSKTQIRLSILDRLLDDHPDQPSFDSLKGDELSVLKESVRDHLQNLLNTRWRCVAWPPDVGDLENSLVNYGIPDFCGSNMGAEKPEVLLNIIRKTIENFEPRLKQVEVTLVGDEDEERVDRTLPFKITASLAIEDHDDPVAYESSLEITTGKLQIGK